MVRFDPVEKRLSLAPGFGVFAVWVVITGIALYLSPNPDGHGTHQQLGLPPCPSVIMFDRPCPGCGLTTSWTALVHGDFVRSFSAHPLGPLLYAIFTGVAFVGIYSFAKKRRFDTSSPKWNKALAAFAVVFFAYGIIRFARTPGYASAGEVQRFVEHVLRQKS